MPPRKSAPSPRHRHGLGDDCRGARDQQVAPDQRDQRGALPHLLRREGQDHQQRADPEQPHHRGDRAGQEQPGSDELEQPAPVASSLCDSVDEQASAKAGDEERGQNPEEVAALLQE